MSGKKYFSPSRMPYSFFKFFVNNFFDVSLTFSDSSSNLFLTFTFFLFTYNFFFLVYHQNLSFLQNQQCQH